MQKQDKRTQAYRRFSFGRRAEDRRHSYALMAMPVTIEDIEERAKEIVLAMESSADLREAILANLQRNAYCVMSFDDAACNK